MMQELQRFNSQIPVNNILDKDRLAWPALLPYKYAVLWVPRPRSLTHLCGIHQDSME